MTWSEYVKYRDKNKHSRLCLALLSLAISGCSINQTAKEMSQQANDFSQRAEQALMAASNNKSQESSNLALKLTDLVQIPALDSYIEQALSSNPELRQSVYALKISYQQLGITSASRLPSASLTTTSEKEKNAPSRSYSSRLVVSWELDLWQQLSDSKAASFFDAQVAEQNLLQIENALVSNIIRACLDITLQRQLTKVEQLRLKSLERSLMVIEGRYKAGLDNLESLDNARTSVFNTQASIAANQQSQLKAERALNLLLGTFSDDVKIDPNLIEFPDVLMPTVPLSSELLQQRPDVKMSFLAIEAEKFRAKSAFKAMLPSFSLTANLTDSGGSLSEVLFKDPIWQLLGQLSAPIFQGGRLKAQATTAEHKFAQQVWAYQETLLSAVNEIENSLSEELALQAQEKHTQKAVLSAERSYLSYREKYKQGLVDIFDLLNTQQQTFDLKKQLTQIKYNRLVNRINLGLALGLGAK